ncbi:MAG: hypothetical protein ACYC3I_25080 [Gemmataceae bacterium]
MASDLGRVKSAPANKYEAFIASQLSQAEKRIRLLDLTAGLLGFAALSLAYVVVMIVCDSKLMLSQNARQLSLFCFLAGGVVYLFFAVLRPLWLRVNPYYAARQVEQQLQDAKNSIVNWVDLHEQPLPSAIRGALGQRAAKDLAHVDLENAISGRRTVWMGGFAGLFALAFLATYFAIGPSPFLSLFKRTFNPFGVGGVSTRTQLTLLKPEGGDAIVTVGRGVNFAVEVTGRVPNPKAADAVKLLYRHEEGDPWQERLLIQEPSREWTTALSAIEVRNGFWYKISGGDAETSEYRVAVRAAPAITDFLATYHFRPYVARADEVSRERELKALRGTEILLRVRTNRNLRDGRLEFEGKHGPRIVRGEVDAKESHTMRVRFVMDEDGKYRLLFTSTDGEAHSDPIASPVTAIPDRPPAVELTKPGKDIQLPADALLHLEGKASDDIGVKSLVLRMRVVGGDTLRGQPYRSDEQLRLADGGYPRDLEYKDFVDLSRVQDENGQAFPLHAGMELDYWLEASDACDYPRPNVTRSKHYRVLLIEAKKNALKQKQEKQQAEKEKKQHEQKQNQKLQKENQERQQQRQEQQARNKEEEKGSQSGNEGNQGGAGENSQPKEGEQADKSQGKENNGQQGGSNNSRGEQGNGEQKSEQAKEDQKLEDKIKKALERKQAGEKGKGEGKPDNSNRGEGKEPKSNQPDGSGAAGDKSKGENKNAGQQDAKDAGQGKDKGQPQAGGDPARGDGKSDNAPSPKPGDKSEPKGGDSRKQAGDGKPGENKDKPQEAKQPGEGKSGGDLPTNKGASQGKPQPRDKGKDTDKNGGKPSAGKEQGSERQPSGGAKDNGGSRNEDKGNSTQKDGGKNEKQPGASTSPQDKPSKQSGTKTSPGQTESEKTTNDKNKPDAGNSARHATSKDINDLARALKSNNPREREEAKRQLQRIEKEAADAEAREKAGEALKKVGQPDGPGEKETQKKGNGPADKPNGDRKEREKDGSKGGRPSGDKDGAKEKSSDPKNGQGTKKAQGSSSADAPGSQGSQDLQSGNTPGGGGERRNAENDPGDTVVPPRGDKTVNPRDHRAAQMQLEDFAKKVNKDILKDAGVSEQEWKKYLESKRKQLATPDKPRPEAVSAPQQASQLPSMGGHTIQPAASGQGDSVAPDRGQPPPQYRDPFRKFTREMSKKN